MLLFWSFDDDQFDLRSQVFVGSINIIIKRRKTEEEEDNEKDEKDVLFVSFGDLRVSCNLRRFKLCSHSSLRV